MSCRGCAQSGDCACVVVGDGGAISVSGGGGAADPYVVSFDGASWLISLPVTAVDTCAPDAYTLVLLPDDTIAVAPAPGRCAVIV